MPRLIPAAERITRAQALIQKARDVPKPVDTTLLDLTYIAEVRDLLQQARDLVKFIPYTPTATPEMKDEVAKIFADADQTQKELLRR